MSGAMELVDLMGPTKNKKGYGSGESRRVLVLMGPTGRGRS